MCFAEAACKKTSKQFSNKRRNGLSFRFCFFFRASLLKSLIECPLPWPKQNSLTKHFNSPSCEQWEQEKHQKQKKWKLTDRWLIHFFRVWKLTNKKPWKRFVWFAGSYFPWLWPVRFCRKVIRPEMKRQRRRRCRPKRTRRTSRTTSSTTHQLTTKSRSGKLLLLYITFRFILSKWQSTKSVFISNESRYSIILLLSIG